MARTIPDSSTVGITDTRTKRKLESLRQESPPVPALTVLCHPEIDRVGDRVLLSELLAGRPAPVARHRPDFTAPGRERGGPLADRHLSRQPIVFRRLTDGTLRLEIGETRTRVLAGGAPVTGDHDFRAEDVRRGAVIELAGRVVLLLHELAPRSAEDERDFGLVGESSGVAAVRKAISNVADLDVPVLLRGETGTGKELVAAAIHRASRRREGPFVAVNLGAVPASLASSELFGAAKGAFTGAVKRQEGYFRGADGGTLLLDEVGEASAEVQVMLLRVLETGEIFPVGSQTPVPVDVRLIAATDADLEAMVRSEGFRAPLLHRLAGFEIHLPPLRQRRDDVGRLLVHFLRRELASIGAEQRLDEPGWVPAGLVVRLAGYDWPGNVRQLRNVVRQLVITSRSSGRLEITPHLEQLLTTAAPEPRASTAVEDSTLAAAPAAIRRKPSEVGEDELRAALRAARWDLKPAAEALSVSRPSLYDLIDKYGIRKAGDLTVDAIADAHRECGGDLDAMVERLEVSKSALKRRVKESGL